MKRPVSPAYSTDSLLTIPLCENGQSDSLAMDLPSKQKRLSSYTLCDVCNIQLNSTAQAQIHYNGKSHQKRLKQINKGKNPNFHGTLNEDQYLNLLRTTMDDFLDDLPLSQ